ncbi:S-layer homology domain-containing protein [Paenibacillus sp. FJAT-26967]|uniref:S-layer homology domain-containing protein n=1 Tax=Paenibacillus sp. FJAT-26967 TaxID=1729690 RepID=UPI0008390305|nr:S-layer homology domain-containing protein [Paenibacillus sp. FJAT-26967]
MKRNRLIAWTLVLCMFLSMFSAGLTVTSANGANLVTAGPEESASVTTDVYPALQDSRSALLQADTENPNITIEGLTDKQILSTKEISFKVIVTDNVYTDIVPEVKVNGTTILPTRAQYQASLVPSRNTVTITAADGAGNRADESYEIIYKDHPANSPKAQLDKNLAFLVGSVTEPTFGTGGGEWSILSLARSDYPVPAGYYDIYYKNVAQKVAELMPKYGDKLDKNKGTEHSRLILGLTSIGREITEVANYDIRKALADYNYVIRQGINGPIFALIAFDSKPYEIPQVSGTAVQTTKEKLIRYILDREIKKGTGEAGGWALSGSNPDPDITGMAIQSLTPYYNQQADVREAVDRAVIWLAKSQKDEGGFASWGTVNSESIAQVVVALTGLGIDPHTDPRFIKNGQSAVDALMSFAVPEGGFMHILPGSSGNGGAGAGVVDGMATDQGTYALVAYDRFVNGKTRLYDMTDVKEDTTKDKVLRLPSGDQPNLAIPQDERNYIVPVTAGDKHKEIRVEIPGDKQSKVFVKLPAAQALPQLEAVKGSASVLLPKGAQVTSGDASAIEMLSPVLFSDAVLRDKINEILPKNKKLDAITQAFSVGGQARVEFSEYVTLTFKGMSGKEAAYIEGGTPHAIHKYASGSEGEVSGLHEYAYDSGNDLIVKTKHFTDYAAYTSSTIQAPGGGGGGITPQPKPYATISVDKETINKGFVVAATDVELQSGDTAWTLLKRVLDSNGIPYEYEWTEKYGSVYVQSIAGDGEFDHGTGSGWMYSVNGSYPNYGATKYVLQNGDRLQWRYTTNLGADLGQDLSQWETAKPPVLIDPNDRTPVVNVPKDTLADYVLDITKELVNTDKITINLPELASKFILNLKDAKDDIPWLAVTKGSIQAVIDKGTKLTAGDDQLELLTTIDPNDSGIQALVKGILKDNEKLDKINHAFVSGNPANPAVFDKPISYIFKDGQKQLPGYSTNKEFTPIVIYETEEAGIQASKGSSKTAYAYMKDNDLVVKINFAATLITYTSSKTAPVVKPQPQPDPKPGKVDLKKLYKDAGTISSWAYQAIEEATANNIIDGSGGKFNPQADVTRAEFTKILAAMLGLDFTEDKVISFKDVSPDEWFYPAVNAAFKAGIVGGFGEEFKPNDKITREQMAVMIIRALGVNPLKSDAGLTDLDTVSSWARNDVETIIALNLMQGYDNQFKPQDYATREMAAVVAVRAYTYSKDSKPGGEKPEPGKPSQGKHEEVASQIRNTAAFLQKSVDDPIIGTVGGEWTVLGLARSGVEVPDAYYAKYYANVEKILKEKSGKLHHIKYTEYDRVILALTSIGKDIKNVAGYDLREPLADFETLIKQGINGPTFALIALDSNQYEIPAVPGVKTQTTREMLIQFILGREIKGGGWALGTNAAEADPDVTSMVIQGLTPYYKTNADVRAAVDRGIAWLSAAQTADGGYTSWGSVNSESIAQVIVALSGLGIDPHRDSRFVKNGRSPVDALLSFAAKEGGFYHIKSGDKGNGGANPGEIDLMATDQAMYALVAYDRFVQGQSGLYDMLDVN